MNILLSTLKEELSTAERLERKYLGQLQKLPNGSFVLRTVGKKRYGYLTRREDGQVIQDYLGSLDDAKINRYRQAAKEKQACKAKLKSVKEQLKILRRALRVKAA